MEKIMKIRNEKILIEKEIQDVEEKLTKLKNEKEILDKNYIIELDKLTNEQLNELFWVELNDLMMKVKE